MIPVRGVARGTAFVVVFVDVDEDVVEVSCLCSLSTHEIVAKAARWEMRVTRQRTMSPGAREDEEVAELLLPLRTTLTRGRCW